MKRRLKVAAVAVAGLASNTYAITAVSRFDTGPEGWTLEGPGQLEWLASGGHSGGCLRVTRTGPGEVYLVAPASYAGTCLNQSLGNGNVCMSILSDRVPLRPLLASWQTPLYEYTTPIDIGCSGCWFPGSTLGAGLSGTSFGAMKLRVGVDPTLPVGEVMLLDDIQLRTSGANCDGSTYPPHLNANDFLCFMIAFAARDPYANYDGSTTSPAINPNDFVTFLNSYAQFPPCP